MFKQEKQNAQSFKASMTNDTKKTRRAPNAIVTTLLIIGLGAGIWFTYNQWQESRQMLAVVVEGVPWAVFLGLGTAMGTSTRRCEGCCLKSIIQRIKRRGSSKTELP